MVLTHFHVKYATISGREYNLLEMKEKMSMHGGGEKSLKINPKEVTVVQFFIRTSPQVDDTCGTRPENAGGGRYTFTFTKGIADMSAADRSALNIKHVEVDVHTFENGTLAGWSDMNLWLLNSHIGYDTIIINAMIAQYEGQGFVHSSRSNKTHDLNYAAEFHESISQGVVSVMVFKLGIFIATTFILFTISTVINFTLRETQQKMLLFTNVVQHRLRHRQYFVQAVVKHALESLVFAPVTIGVFIFMSGVYVDNLTAFGMMTLMWCCELFSVLSLRTTFSIQFFPRVFCAYFFLFHTYFFSYPYGYSYMAFGALVCWISHSMWFFWSRYELSAIEKGIITERAPRAAVGGMI
jgi:hypothetical protein